MFQRSLLGKFWLFFLSAVVIIYTALLIGLSVQSQRSSYDAALETASNEFDAQVRVLDYEYHQLSDHLYQLSELNAINVYYANLMLGMSYRYGLSDSLFNISTDIREVLMKHDLGSHVRAIEFVDAVGGYRQNIRLVESAGQCGRKFSTVTTRELFFIGDAICLQVPVIYKQLSRGVLHVELSASIFDISSFSGSGHYYLLDPAGGYWQWDQTGRRWLATDQGPPLSNDNFLFSAELTSGGFGMLRSLPSNELISFTQTTEFIIALSGLALLVWIAGYKVVRYREQNLLLNAEVAQERQHIEKLSQANKRLESEMTRREALEQQLSYRAHHDMLTGLPNREQAIACIDEAIARAQPSRNLLAVVFCDLDRFKQVNDTLGHDAGDSLITNAAERLQAVVGKNDMVARFGGDEFLLLVESCDSVHAVELLCQRLIGVFQQPFHLMEHEFTVTCSMGVALFPRDSANSAELIKQADTALYRAKEDGRAAWRFYQPALDMQLQSRLNLEQKLLSKEWDDHLCLMYQPIVHAQTGRVEAIEALVRWRDEDGLIIGPDQFIPIAEDLGLIGEIGEWVLRRVVRDNRWFANLGITSFVNISPLQFVWKTPLLELIRQISQEEGVAIHGLGLEVTESSLVRNVDEVKFTLDQLARDGMHLAIDDFGTGYSSLSYLKRFPFNRIKIDKSFVRDICDDPGDLELVRAIIAMARAMNLNVIAEGVETTSQLGVLRELACDYVQGYFYSRPLVLEEMIAFCEEQNEMMPA